MDDKIHCKACNCIYHDGFGACTADRVEIGCKNARTCKQTECATFEMKK